MKLGVVTDSTCDLPVHLVQQHDLQVVPSILVIEGKEYADGIGFTRQDFYARLPEFKASPTTAAPSIGDFSAQYRRLLDRGCEHVISIHAAEALTGIAGAARQAATDFEGRVTVIDSQSLSLGLGFQVLAAAEALEQGLQEVLRAIESTRRRLHVFAVLDTLEYVRRSGRIPSALKVFGSLLHVKPMIELTNGEVKAVAALRTTRKADDRMAAFFRAGGRMERLAILHTGAEDRAREFLTRMMHEDSRALPHEIMMVNVTPVIGVHVGPNGMGFAAVRA